MATRKGGVAAETEESEDDPLLLESPLTSDSIEEIDVKEIEREDDDTSIEMISPMENEDSSVSALSPSLSSSGPQLWSEADENSPDTSMVSSAAEAIAGDAEETKLAGWLKISLQGFRRNTKHAWFVYDDEAGKLFFYRQQEAIYPLGNIDVRNASFSYSVSNRDKPGLFEINSDGRSYSLEAEDHIHKLYWLESLQKKRKTFSQRRSNAPQNLENLISGRKSQLASSGLLGEKKPGEAAQHGFEADQNNSGAAEAGNGTGISLLNLSQEIRKTMSTFRLQIGNKLNRQPEDWTVVEDSPSPPHSPVPPLPTSTTQWHVPVDFTESRSACNPIPSNTVGAHANLVLPKEPKVCSSSQSDLVISTEELPGNQSKMPSSSSASLPARPVSPTNTVSNGRSKFMSAFRSNFAKSVKDKTGRLNPRAGKLTVNTNTDRKESNSSVGRVISPTMASHCSRCRVLGDDLFSVKEDLRAAEEELEANREIVRLLQKEIDVLRLQIQTRNECDGMEEEQMMHALDQKNKHVIELEHSRAAILEEKSLLAQKSRLEFNELKDLREQISMFQQTLTVKDEMIVHLANQNHELKNNNKLETVSEMSQTSLGMEPDTLAANEKELELFQKKCQEYEKHNLFQKKEIQELLELRKDDQARERMLNMSLAEHEAKYCQIHSKYLFLLNEKQPIRGGDEGTSQEAVSQLLKEALESETAHDQDDVDGKDKVFISSKCKEYDQYGFIKNHLEDVAEEDILLSRAKILQHQSLEMKYLIRDADELTSKRIKWENFMVGQDPKKHLVRSNDLKTLIRLGVPYEFRERVWMSCINMFVGPTRQKHGPAYYKELEERAHSNRFNPATKQIELDLLRTLPGNRFFEKIDSDGIQKLRRVLLCYSVHDPLIGYCQGLNRIAAIALLFLREEEAFWCLVSVIDHLMPPDYYTSTLAAAQADQRVLKDLVQEKLPRLYSHLENHDVDLSLFTFNWFLTIFVDNVKPDIFLHVWDCFQYEGSKILFRFALAFLKYAEEEILEQPNALMINRYMRTLGICVTDVKKVLTIAFTELNPFPMKSINTKRAHHLQIIKEELKELDAIRKDFKSARTAEEDSERSDKSGYVSDGDLDDN